MVKSNAKLENGAKMKKLLIFGSACLMLLAGCKNKAGDYAAAQISIIGGADGPTTIYVAHGSLWTLVFAAVLCAAAFSFSVYKLIKSIKSRNKTGIIIFSAITALFACLILAALHVFY